MVALRIGDIRGFTSRLFVRETFDRLLVREAQVVTYNAFTIDGRIRQGYYTKDEIEAEGIGEFSRWKAVRPLCFALIRGKKLPGSFRIRGGSGIYGAVCAGSRRQLAGRYGKRSLSGGAL